MLYPGLCSISFRDMTVDQVIDLAARAGLKGIEWGGDVHVPHGRTDVAAEVMRKTREAGLACSSYGSYYRVGHSETAESLSFQEVLDTALELEVPTVRIWAGKVSSEEASDGQKEAIVKEARRVAEMARTVGVQLAFEYHGGTLTDTPDSAEWLMQQVGHPNLSCYWQPPVELSHDRCLQSLHGVLAWLSNVHVFHWVLDHGRRDRRPLQEGAGRWSAYAEAAGRAEGDRWALLEFVREDDPRQLLEDAEVLKGLVAGS